MKKFRVAFCGTPDFSVPTLDMLFNHPHVDLVKVISMPDRPAGRGMELKSPEVIEYAKAKKIPFFQTENINREPEMIKELKSLDLDFVVVLAFAQFLGSDMLNMGKLGCFNIHTSVLPKYRGAAPIQYALLNGDTETGVSIQKMVKKMDAGDLVHFHTVAIAPTENGGQLYTRLKFQAALAMNDLIVKLLDNKVTYTAQDESKVSFAPTLKKEDGLLK
jgi:methionyl-tRNA formyltransferase